MENKKKRIRELVELINKWNKEYFDEENPSVSDRVYDSHLRELIELEKENPQFSFDDSPTKKIGATTGNKFEKVMHSKQMLSLNKAYTKEEIEKFFSGIINEVSNKDISFLVQPKIDGLSIALRYKDGNLVQAITRGDGIIGEDVTENVKGIISSIPTKINYKNNLEVRGEIYISKANFKKILNEEKNDYANSRNLASGTLRQLDKNIVKKRNLDAFIYEIANWEEVNIKTQKTLIEFLIENQFPVLKNYSIVEYKNKEKIFSFIDDFENSKRDELEYDIDGMVIKLNEFIYYDMIGFTSKFPKYAIAYKFDDELIETTIQDIFITIGRTGVVTYNAKLLPVLLKGTTVSAATLHNYKYIEELGINISDDVMIKKAGEIIPKVVSLSKKKTNGVFEKILTCPSCKSNLIDSRTLNNQYCINTECPEINIKKIIHFASKGAMNIDGLGEGIVRKFYELGFIKKIEDIYTLEKYKDEIISTKGFGEKFWKNLEDGINESYKVNINNLIFALGVPQLGARNAKSISQKIKSFENIFSLDEETLRSINDIGDITIKEFNKYMKNEQNIEMIKFLINIGINPQFETNNITIDFFKDKTFVISGTLDIPREKLTKIIEDNGGRVSNSVSKKTDYLILGENGGSKRTKAIELKIPIINKNEISEILNKK